MRATRLLGGCLLGAALLGACSVRVPVVREAAGQLYEAEATVLQRAGEEAMLCLGVIALSYPPQCGTMPIPNWDWGAVADETSASGVTWGTYRVRGELDGDAFVLVGPPDQIGTGSVNEPDRTIASCSPAARGDADPARATAEAMERTIARARDRAGFAGAWVTRPDGDERASDPAREQLNLAFTGRLPEARAHARETWSGLLCVTRYERSLADLRRIQDRLIRPGAEELGLRILSIGVSEDRNVVSVHVVVAPDGVAERLDGRYGEGVVVLTAALKPIG